MSKSVVGVKFGSCIVITLAGALTVCCAGSKPTAEMATPAGEPARAQEQQSRAPSYDDTPNYDYAPPAPEARAAAPSVGESARGGAGAAKSKGHDARDYEEPSAAPRSYHRPGLATQWGEERESRIRETVFVRQRAYSPYAQVAIRYDDEDGVRALTGLDDRYAYPGVFSLAGGALTVSLTESDGDPWPALTSGGTHYVIGDEGDRYSIHLTNHSPGRFEIVASVDGLDVIDGGDAEFSKRGYIVAPWGSLDIDGFRSSSRAVNAFRFGEIEDSYAVARGRGADVGVVGVAVFEEQGWEVDTRRWNTGHHEPNPFPGRFAPPPGY